MIVPSLLARLDAANADQSPAGCRAEAQPASEADTTAPPAIDVVLLSWRNVDKTRQALRALHACGYPNLRLVVVDNGSDDGAADDVADALRELFPDAALVRSAQNLGYPAGMNLGLRTARARGGATYFCLLANDVAVQPGAFEALVARCEADPTIGLCGATQHLLADHGTVLRTIPGGVRYVPALGWNVSVRSMEPAVVERRMTALQGALVFGTMAFLDAVGPMGTDRFVYFEEAEWARRAKRAGFRLGWAPDAVVHNLNSRTMVGYHDRTERLAATHYLMARGGVVYTKRHHPWLLPTVIAARLVRSAEDVVRKGPDVGRMSVLGIIDGLRGTHRRLPVLGDARLPTDPIDLRADAAEQRVGEHSTTR